MHAPKVETFDVPAMTNTDPKGFVRPVERYQVEPFGLYMHRDFVGHPKVAGIVSWLLPELGIRVSNWLWHPGKERDQDFYLDIADVDREGDIWRTVDHYLDLVVCTGRDSAVVDVDEYVEAVAHGLLARDAAERALESSYRALAGLAAHGHDLGRWLAGLEINLTWQFARA